MTAFDRPRRFLTPQDHAAQRLSRGLLGAWILLIVTASLYPFDTEWSRLIDAVRDGWPKLREWREPSQRDAMVNLLLYVPFGLLGSMALEKGHGLATRLMLPLLGAALLSLAIELLQHALPPRDPSLADWVFNIASAVIGMVLAGIYSSLPVRPLSRRLQRLTIGPAPTLLVGLWLVAHLAPFVPRLRPGRIEAAIDTSLAMAFSIGDALGYFACYLVLSTLLNALLKRPYFWSAMFSLIGIALAGRLLFVGQHLGSDEAAAAIAAFLVVAILRRLDPRGWDGHAFLLSLLAVFLAGVWPPVSSAALAVTQEMVWLPFGELAGFPADPGALPILERLFLGAGIAWLALNSSLRYLPPLPFALLVVLSTEFLQQWVIGRVPDTTDIAALVIGAALAAAAPRIDPRA